LLKKSPFRLFRHFRNICGPGKNGDEGCVSTRDCGSRARRIRCEGRGTAVALQLGSNFLLCRL
jgi:hypothetical protein